VLLAAAKGVVGATVVTMGLITLPAMLRHGYDPRLAAGTVAATATLAQIMPPATVLVLLGDQLNTAYQAAQLAEGKFAPEQVSVTDLGNGSINVQLGDAANPLVADTTVNWPQALTAPGGKLGALLAISKTGGVIDSYVSDLNKVVKTIADAVNTLHNPGGTGSNFFSYTAGSEAATLAVAVTTAGVRTSATAAPGANDIALQIAGLRGGTGDALYTAFVTRIGGDVKTADTGHSNANVLLNSINDRRQSTSGVSMDEEMTNLVKFQRAYQASARAMTTMDDMLDVLINRTGKVGL